MLSKENNIEIYAKNEIGSMSTGLVVAGNTSNNIDFDDLTRRTIEHVSEGLSSTKSKIAMVAISAVAAFGGTPAEASPIREIGTVAHITQQDDGYVDKNSEEARRERHKLTKCLFPPLSVGQAYPKKTNKYGTLEVGKFVGEERFKGRHQRFKWIYPSNEELCGLKAIRYDNKEMYPDPDSVGKHSGKFRDPNAWGRGKAIKQFLAYFKYKK